jgi:hypothetical protein
MVHSERVATSMWLAAPGVTAPSPPAHDSYPIRRQHRLNQQADCTSRSDRSRWIRNRITTGDQRAPNEADPDSSIGSHSRRATGAGARVDRTGRPAFAAPAGSATRRHRQFGRGCRAQLLPSLTGTLAARHRRGPPFTAAVVKGDRTRGCVPNGDDSLDRQYHGGRARGRCIEEAGGLPTWPASRRGDR